MKRTITIIGEDNDKIIEVNVKFKTKKNGYYSRIYEKRDTINKDFEIYVDSIIGNMLKDFHYSEIRG